MPTHTCKQAYTQCSAQILYTKASSIQLGNYTFTNKPTHPHLHPYAHVVGFLLTDVKEPLCCFLKQVHQEGQGQVQWVMDMAGHHQAVVDVHLECVAHPHCIFGFMPVGMGKGMSGWLCERKEGKTVKVLSLLSLSTFTLSSNLTSLHSTSHIINEVHFPNE